MTLRRASPASNKPVHCIITMGRRPPTGTSHSRVARRLPPPVGRGDRSRERGRHPRRALTKAQRAGMPIVVTDGLRPRVTGHHRALASTSNNDHRLRRTSTEFTGGLVSAVASAHLRPPVRHDTGQDLISHNRWSNR